MYLRLLGRVLESLLTLLTVALISFLLFRFLGDPARSLLGENASVEAIDRLRREAGLDDPTLLQFFRYLTRVLGGDFGYSYQDGNPVLGLLWERLPASLELVLCAALLTLCLALPAGIYCAARPGSWLERLIQIIALSLSSLPTFLLGLLLLYLLAWRLPLFPAAGRQGWTSLLLPTLTLSAYHTALLIRLVQSQMSSTLESGYIRFARSRGIPWPSLLFRHALPNAAYPLLSAASTQFSSILVFALATESVFQWPGLASLFLQAIRYGDLPLLTAYLLFASLFFVLTQTAVDLIALQFDPRLRSAPSLLPQEEP